MVSLERMPARELFTEMKKYKSEKEIVKGTNHTTAEVFGPIIAKYSRNYDDRELRSLINVHDDVHVDTGELHVRLSHIRFLLAQSVVGLANYACITLSMNDFNFAYIYVLLRNPPEVVYISIGDSIQSYDGEWRGLMTNTAGYEYVIKNYADVFDKILTTTKFKNATKMHIYYNTSLLGNTIAALKSLVNDTYLGKNLLGLAWFVGKYESKSKILSPAFAKFCKLGGDFDMALFDSVKLDDIYRIIGSFLDKKASPGHSVIDNSVRCGQKLIQLTPDETSHPLSTSYQAWNEIQVTKEATDLVINMICPGFAIHSFWLMIFETTKFMYNIKDMRARIAQSQTIRLTPNDKRTNKILSSQAVCVTNEYCGPTFRHSILEPTLGPKTLQFGSKYVFEMVYALFCMHSLLNQFHGDFHCDNATIMQLVDPVENPNRKICYIVGNDKFSFNHNGSYGCVIDFSRSIHMDNPMWIERITEKYELYFPSWWKQQNSSFVYDALDDSSILELLKRRATAFDIYEFAHTSLQQCEKILKGTELGSLLESIKSEASAILTESLETIHENISGSSEKKQNDWAALTILKKYWPSARITEFPTKDVFCGIYTYNNEQKYSARSYESLPRSISHGPIIRDNDDEPVDLYSVPALAIKMRYALWNEILSDFLKK